MSQSAVVNKSSAAAQAVFRELQDLEMATDAGTGARAGAGKAMSRSEEGGLWEKVRTRAHTHISERLVVACGWDNLT